MRSETANYLGVSNLLETFLLT
ncbi:hypothetical protein GMMP15_100001 [Candidatus Magnetomoraceae bacterium gMMP-15]